MPLLAHHEILEIHAAALAAGLTRSRDALLAGLDQGFVAGMPLAASPTDQVMLDLDGLAKAERLLDGTVPLQRWLATAAQLAGRRAEAKVFARYRDRLGPMPAARDDGPAKSPPKPTPQPAGAKRRAKPAPGPGKGKSRVQAGARSVVAGGDVTGSVIVTGDGNHVSIQAPAAPSTRRRSR
jgi:hypothetical protein